MTCHIHESSLSLLANISHSQGLHQKIFCLGEFGKQSNPESDRLDLRERVVQCQFFSLFLWRTRFWKVPKLFKIDLTPRFAIVLRTKYRKSARNQCNDESQRKCTGVRDQSARSVFFITTRPLPPLQAGSCMRA